MTCDEVEGLGQPACCLFFPNLGNFGVQMNTGTAVFFVFHTVKAVGVETPLVYMEPACPLHLQASSCSKQRLPDLPWGSSSFFSLEQQACCH